MNGESESDWPAGRSLIDLGPESYTDWRASSLGTITDRLEQRLILALSGDVAGRDLLDVGCGDGTFALMLHQKGARVTGIDASPDMIAAARRAAETGGAHVAFREGRAEALPFDDGSFDIVMAITVLCFVDDAAAVFRELARVLRPGGRLVIGELGKWSTWAAVRRVRAWLGDPLWRRGRFRTAGEMRRLAAGAGLAVEHLRGAVYYPRYTLAARLMAPYDDRFGNLTTLGAAFLALSARKPDVVQRPKSY